MIITGHPFRVGGDGFIEKGHWDCDCPFFVEWYGSCGVEQAILSSKIPRGVCPFEVYGIIHVRKREKGEGDVVT